MLCTNPTQYVDRENTRRPSFSDRVSGRAGTIESHQMFLTGDGYGEYPEYTIILVKTKRQFANGHRDILLIFMPAILFS